MAKQKKRADGRYCKNITIGRNEDGSLKRKMIYANTQKELELKVAELTLQVDKGCVIDDKSMTVATWAQNWFETYKTGYKANTMKQYRSLIKKYIEPNFNNIKLKDLKPYHVQKVLNDIEATNNVTPKKFLSAMNQILNAAVENYFVSKNVASSLKYAKRYSELKEPLTKEEINIIKNTQHEIQNICLFLIYSGLRISELTNLTWQYIDLKNRFINVNGDVKTPNSFRRVPIVEPLYKLLKTLDDSRIKNINKKEDYIFKNDNEIYGQNKLRELRYEYIELCGFDFTYHQLRHTCASLLYYSGVKIKEAQEWLGHASAKTTLDIYTHLQEKEKQTATDQIDLYLKSI